MEYVFEASGLTKQFDDVTALDHINLKLGRPSIVGLLGKNGSGKTTLIQHLMGLQLPNEGTVKTLDQSSDKLGHDALTQIGYVPQEIGLLDWMTVEQHVRYVSCFYPDWDQEREKRLLSELELDTEKPVGKLSTGNLQKLAIILAVCHHPQLLILDEPVSDLDPIVRAKLLEFLLEVLREDQATILVSSHVLRDVEKIVDWVVCLDNGRVVTDAGLDELKERYAEWRIVSRNGDLPTHFTEPFVHSQEISGSQALLRVRQADANLETFRATHGVEVTARPLNLEEMFPILVGEGAA
ncbi:MAG: ABC transporter ATP-binding protein [Acidobacteriota bacterium]|nr:ABC transporter ATP-binding protein [Acidobacteriota bacterium]MDH3784614.1 ABC transporter ATP-binding protein [Acidobacteriota bacterium]